MKIEQALAMVKNGESLQGVVLENVDATQVSVRDALSLARSGIVIPEQNVFYDDDAIAYDEEIDAVNGQLKPQPLLGRKSKIIQPKQAKPGYTGNNHYRPRNRHVVD